MGLSPILMALSISPSLTSMASVIAVSVVAVITIASGIDAAVFSALSILIAAS